MALDRWLGRTLQEEFGSATSDALPPEWFTLMDTHALKSHDA